MFGRVLWFDVKKGFGFIKSDEEGPDIFVHYSKIEAEPGEFRLLEANDRVEFEKFEADRDGPKKTQARRVKKIP